MDKGPWKVFRGDYAAEHQDRLVVGSDDFEHDVWLYVTGDFEDAAAAEKYAEWLAGVLNAARAADQPTAVQAIEWRACPVCDSQIPARWRPFIGIAPDDHCPYCLLLRTADPTSGGLCRVCDTQTLDGHCPRCDPR